MKKGTPTKRWPQRTTKQRFEEKVNKTAGCWLWTAAFRSNGYGAFQTGERVEAAHRVAWTLYHGEIPRDMNVLHKCDNPACVKPSHLFLGTHADNNHDKWLKGRARVEKWSGENNGNSKLTADKVREIRKLIGEGWGCRRLARRFNVDTARISRIRNRKIWKLV